LIIMVTYLCFELRICGFDSGADAGSESIQYTA